MKPFIAILILLLAFSASVVAQVSILSGRVIRVADGDTLTILTPENEKIRVRLVDIDAPEKKQAFGTRSKHALSDLCLGVDAIVSIRGYDHYKRALGLVSCGGTIANQRQVETGMAWVYQKYSNDPKLLEMEEEARQARRGLWSEPSPIPPWEFRKQRKSKSLNAAY
jgi:micrococcal nuclease